MRSVTLGRRGADLACIGTMALWALYLLLAPTTGFYWIDSWHNEQRAVQLILLAVTAVSFVYAIAQGAATLSISRLAGALLVIGVVSSLRATLPLAAFAEVGHLFLLVLLALVSATFFAQDAVTRWRWAHWLALFFAAAYVLGVAVRYVAALQLDQPLERVVFLLGYANPRFPSAMHALLLPMLAMTAVDDTERRSIRATAAVVLPLLVAINLALGTRAIWFGCVAAGACVCLLAGWARARRLLLSLAAGIVVGIVVYLLLFRIGTPATGAAGVASPLDNLTLTHRDVLWSMSWNAIADAPVLGIGPMQFAAVENYYGAHPHNWVLQVGAEWGLPALGIIAWLLWRFAARLRGALRRSADPGFMLSLAFAAVAALAIGLVDGNLVMPVSQSLAAIAFGACGAAFAPSSLAPAAAPSRGRVLLVTLLAVAAVGVVGAFALESFPQQEEQIRRFRAMFPGAWLVPRFWEQGLLID